MILSEILSEIRRSLSEPATGGHWDDPALLRRINIGQKKIVRMTSCMEAVWTATTVAAQAPYSKPVTCLRVLRAYYEYAGKRLYPVTTADLDIYASTGKIASPWTDTTGTPTNYYETLRNIWLYPIPDSTGVTLGIEGIVRPDDLVIGTLTGVPFNDEPYMYDFHDMLISYVLWRCMLEDGNAQYAVHKTDFIEGLASITRDMKVKPDTMGTFTLIRRNSNSTRGPLPGL